MPRTTSYADRPRYEDADFRGFIGRVKMRLLQLDMNQSDLAKKLDIDHATVSGWMNLKYKPKFEAIPHIGHALRCDLNWLFTGQGTPDKEPLSEPEGQYQGASLALADVQAALNVIARQWMEKSVGRGTRTRFRGRSAQE